MRQMASFAPDSQGPQVTTISEESTTATSTTDCYTTANATDNLSQLISSPTTSPPRPHQSSVDTHRQYHTPSKLPAFRFVDFKVAQEPEDSLALTQNSLGSTDRELDPATHDLNLLRKQAPQSNAIDPQVASAVAVAVTDYRHHHCNFNHHKTIPPGSPQTAAATPKTSPARSRASTYQTASTSAPITPTAKRTVSFPLETPTTSTQDHDTGTQDNAPSPTYFTPATRPRPRRVHTSGGSPSALPAAQSPAAGGNTKEWAQGQRELLLPKAVQGTLPNDKVQRRQSTINSRPPLTYRPSLASSTPGRAVIPPIRSFRSSGCRKSLQDEMNDPVYHSYDDGDDFQKNKNPRDYSLRALEGRRTSDAFSPETDDDETLETLESDNTADLFMNIAGGGKSFTRRGPDGRGEERPNGAITRVVRTARQRPLSFASSPFQKTSPPRLSRRLSDQQETARSTRITAEQPVQFMPRELAYQNNTKDKSALRSDPSRPPSTVSSLRPSPITPRTRDNTAESSPPQSRRRPSIGDKRPSFGENPPRSSANKHSYGHSKTYNSSPLVPRHADSQHPSGAPQAGEGTESSNSTAAPSTVWDELDDLKSRIHRLELTGKLPKTSGAAMSRVSDERPPTAGTTGTNGTNPTTISNSPKQRSAGKSVAPTDAISTSSSQRENQPILISALSKSKPFVSAEVYDAIEAAATDALALSQMMGTVGQPGPISSGASAIGTGGTSTVTDRQLRRKADSICRSLTELCLALGEGQKQPVVTTATVVEEKEEEEEETSSPPRLKVFTAGISGPRRGSAGADQPLPSIEATSSPRAARLEKRATLYNFTGFTGLSTPRYPRTPGMSPSVAPSIAPSIAPSAAPSFAPTVTLDTPGPGRQSSLVVARSRRGVTEEPDDLGRKSSLLRTRRAGTEEPEEGRKSSLHLQSRRNANNNNEDEEESRFRGPPRAVTEIGGLRAPPRDNNQTRGSVQDTGNLIVPRRRVATSNFTSSRLVVPSPTMAGPLSGRRFFERPTRDGDTSSFVGPSPTTNGPLSGRRFFERSPRDGDTNSVVGPSPTTSSSLVGRGHFERPTADRDTNSVAEKLAEDRGQRQYSGGQTATANRTSNTSTSRKRTSIFPSMAASSSAAGGYR